MNAADVSSWPGLFFVVSYVAAIGIPLIIALVPSAKRFFVQSRTTQATAAFTVLLLLGLTLPRAASLSLMVLAWSTYLMGSRRRQEWAWALWLPLSGTSLLATFLWLSVIGKAFSPSEGMGPGFAKFGAIVIFNYFMVAPLVLFLSIVLWPREPERVRLQSIACGLSFLIGFAVATVYRFSKAL